MERISDIIKNFALCGDVKECIPYGNGHINDTFLVVSEDNGIRNKYVLQSVNNNVFKKPEEVMDNIARVTKYLRNVADDPREIVHLVPTVNDTTYFKDNEGYCWRVYEFVTGSICLDLPETTEDFYQSAVAFGKFQKMLKDFPAETLHETIPNFHNTPVRYENFLKAVEEDKYGRAASVKKEIEFVKARKDFYSVLLDNNACGKLPLRVSHNDTKINNVMLDAKTRKALCVIDLDTIMPGFSVTDFGDAIRFGASTAAEDEIDINKVSLDIDMFAAYTEGFLEGCGGQLPNDEIMLLPEGAKMMTIECGIRFLTDYLEGDTYFKTSYNGHNLVRCHTQFKLVADMEEKWDQLKAIVKKYCK